MLAVSMPNFDDLCRRWWRRRRSAWRRRFVVAEAFEAPLRGRMWALVMVSSVVKVLEETMKRVSAGSRSRVASAKSVPSTLETKRKVMLAVGCSARSAS